MHKRIIVFLVLISCLSIIYAQDFNYVVSLIPDSLVKNAKAVVRKNIVEFEMKYLNACSRSEKTVITVLDRSGKELAYGYFMYDSEKSIVSISAIMYDKYGKILERYSRHDFNDNSYDLFGSLYSDSRYLSFTKSSTGYPYTIEYNVTYSYSYSYSFPKWFPQDDYDMSVEYAKLSVIVPTSIPLKYKMANTEVEPIVTNRGNKQTYTWELSGLPAIEYEPFSPSARDRFPDIEVNPVRFGYNGYNGSFSSWTELGKYYGQLNEGRNDLSEKCEHEIHNLVDSVTDTREKVRILYKYMQDNTRYVSIQVGIGGIRPFPASTVEKYGYGDCKALTNYMQSILAVAGIKSYYTLINAGSGNYSFDTSFVSNMFNHVILNVPMENDDIWLECTSQSMPFGFLGDFTDDRYCLMITEQGGVIKKTPAYGLSDNRTISTAKVIIGTSGITKATTHTQFTGLSYDDIMGLLRKSPEDQEDYLYHKRLSISDFKVQSFSYYDNGSEPPLAVENLELDLINYASVSGNRIFVPVNLIDKFDYIPTRDNDRKSPLILQQDSWETDTIVFVLPGDYSIEYCPESDTLKSDFGKLTYAFEIDDNSITCIRNFEFYKGDFSNDKYSEFVSFCKSMNRADKQKIVLVKNE